jgi:predicted CoA-substrate-specific enzyme activase
MMRFLKRLGNNKMTFFIGLDLGSTSTKIVLINQDKTIINTYITGSGNNFRKSAGKALNTILSDTDLELNDIANIVATGYGRFISDLDAKPMSEITCCGRGANFLPPGTRTIIDIGGQDSKAIRIDDKGKVLQFAMNDKCAAGTGRFLDRIAASLELSVEEMGEISVNSKEELPISSQCTVFAETEVISKISIGESIEGIVRGLHSALSSRIFNLVVGLNIEKDIFLCGGGAKNIGMIEGLRNHLTEIIVPHDIDPRLVPAIGAALLSCDSYKKEANK